MAETQAQRRYRESLERNNRNFAERQLSYLAEVASGFNRPFMQLTDYAIVNPLNTILGQIKTQYRIPSAEQTFAPKAGTFTGREDLLSRTMQATGEGAGLGLASYGTAVGLASRSPQALQYGMSNVGQLTQPARNVFQRYISDPIRLGGRELVQQTAATPLSTELAYSGLAGAGMELGGALLGEAPLGRTASEYGLTGENIGSLLLPLAGAGTQRTASYIRDLTNFSQRNSSEAAEILAESMVRSGLTPKDVEAQFRSLGPNAIPADISREFTRLLKVATNLFPEMEGAVNTFLNQRQSLQSERIMRSFSMAGRSEGLDVDDVINQLDAEMTPRINALYQQARSQGLELSPRFISLLEKSPALSGFRQRAEDRLATRRAIGESVGNIDLIDQMKRLIDNDISVRMREGARDEVRELVQLKKILLEQANIPEYVEARALYAGKAALEEAADQGRQYLRMRPRDIQSLRETYTPEEFAMFSLGAKDAILEKIENMQTMADVTRLFSRNGDVGRLKALFPSEEDFIKFQRDIFRESQFIATRRGIQGNSTTTQQMFDLGQQMEARIPESQSVYQVVTSYFKRRREAKTLEERQNISREIGEFLSREGMDPVDVFRFLQKGNERRLDNLLVTIGRNANTGMPITQAFGEAFQDLPATRLRNTTFISSGRQQLYGQVPESQQTQGEQAQQTEAQRQFLLERGFIQ